MKGLLPTLAAVLLLSPAAVQSLTGVKPGDSASQLFARARQAAASLPSAARAAALDFIAQREFAAHQPQAASSDLRTAFALAQSMPTSSGGAIQLDAVDGLIQAGDLDGALELAAQAHGNPAVLDRAVPAAIAAGRADDAWALWAKRSAGDGFSFHAAAALLATTAPAPADADEVWSAARQAVLQVRDMPGAEGAMAFIVAAARAQPGRSDTAAAIAVELTQVMGSAPASNWEVQSVKGRLETFLQATDPARLAEAEHPAALPPRPQLEARPLAAPTGPGASPRKTAGAQAPAPAGGRTAAVAPPASVPASTEVLYHWTLTVSEDFRLGNMNFGDLKPAARALADHPEFADALPAFAADLAAALLESNKREQVRQVATQALIGAIAYAKRQPDPLEGDAEAGLAFRIVAQIDLPLAEQQVASAPPAYQPYLWAELGLAASAPPSKPGEPFVVAQ